MAADDIRGITIEGGIHPKYADGRSLERDIDEKALAQLAQDLAITIERFTKRPAWVNVKYTATVGHKLNS